LASPLRQPSLTARRHGVVHLPPPKQQAGVCHISPRNFGDVGPPRTFGEDPRVLLLRSASPAFATAICIAGVLGHVERRQKELVALLQNTIARYLMTK
jgi:hypothetical protein